jgi:serine-type D-Ala-D-Ala carboxypeptidase/endopeptidase
MRWTLVVVVFCAAVVGAQSPYPVPQFADPSRAARLVEAARGAATELDQARRTLRAPGLSWGVIVDGAVVASGASGVARVGEATPVDEDTVFRIASMTKSFTALAVLALRDEGKLSLDDPAGKYIQELATMPLPTRDAPAITVRHLLTHSAGFPEDNPWGDRQLAQPRDTLLSWVRAGLPFSTTPGTAYEYSNYGFALLGQIVARASGMPYRDFVTTRILRPLGMTSTFWDPADVPAGRRAQGYRWNGSSWEEEIPLADGSFGAMGGLLTSGRDLGRYIAFMLSAWPPRDDADNGPVKRSSVREMQQGQRFASLTAKAATDTLPMTAVTRAYAYGLNSASDCSYRFIVSHGGGLPGFGSNMTWLPEYGVGVYVMANVTYAGPGGAARAVLDRLNATGALKPRDLPASPSLLAVRERVVSLVNGWKDETLIDIAADNLLLDRALATRRDALTALHQRLGTCRIGDDIDAENWLRGRFRLTCERGALDTTVTLAPTNPPRVQDLDFSEAQGSSVRAMSPPCDQ